MQETFRYGSVYKVTREDTFENIRHDFEMMIECGMDTVVIWPPVFYWEDQGPDYPFSTGKKILEIADVVGLKVIMELAGQLSVFEYIPDSEMKKEYYAVDDKGNREWGQHSFGFLNYYHPEVKAKITANFAKIAGAYKEYNALYGYDVFNETMFRSFDPYTIDAFRRWLQNKYTIIERLNDVWERTYTDFSQIQYEHHKWMSIMPKADYFAFRKAAIGIIIDDWVKAIRDVDSEHTIIADNIHSQVTLKGDFARPQDDFDLKNHVDEIGMSFYPKSEAGCFEPAQRFQIFSGFWAASKNQGFFISEMQTHIQALFNPHTAVRPYELKQWCFEAYSSGAKALLYWMWRPFTKGLQTGGRGLVDYKGRFTERFEIAKSMGETFKKYGALEPCTGKVGIVYDPLCDDFQRLYTEAYQTDQQIYLASLFGAYKMLFDLNISCDMIKFDEIEKYQAIILTNQIVISPAQVEKLEKYIADGGTCIIDGKFGTVDDTSMMYDVQPGGSANFLVGQDLIDSDYDKMTFTYAEDKVNGFYCRELVEVTNGNASSSFEDGKAAVVELHYGTGMAISINTFLFYGYEKTTDVSQAAFIKKLLANCNVETISSNLNVKAKLMKKEQHRYIIAFNYTESVQTAEVRYDNTATSIAVPANDVILVEV